MAAQRKPYCRHCDRAYTWHEWANRRHMGRCKYPKDPVNPTSYEECTNCPDNQVPHEPACRSGKPHCSCDTCF